MQWVMDPSIIRAISDIVGPVIALLVLGAVPISLLLIKKHYLLKTRELELESEFHGRQAQARLQALETRQAGMESALSALVQALTTRSELLRPELGRSETLRSDLLSAPPDEQQEQPLPGVRPLTQVK
jgi:Tfp pilus assembly protein PilO